MLNYFKFSHILRDFLIDWQIGNVSLASVKFYFYFKTNISMIWFLSTMQVIYSFIVCVGLWK